MAEKKPHKIDPKVGDRLVIPADRHREEREVVVVSVARIKFQTVNADKHDDYQNYIQSTSNTIAFHNRFGLTTWRKDTAQEDGWGGSGPRVATRARLDEEKRERGGVGLPLVRDRHQLVGPVPQEGRRRPRTRQPDPHPPRPGGAVAVVRITTTGQYVKIARSVDITGIGPVDFPWYDKPIVPEEVDIAYQWDDNTQTWVTSSTRIHGAYAKKNGQPSARAVSLPAPYGYRDHPEFRWLARIVDLLRPVAASTSFHLPELEAEIDQ